MDLAGAVDGGDGPPGTARLIGREDETSEVLEALGDPDIRVVTLAGPPGVGKTALAQQVGRRLEATATRWHFVDATVARSPADVHRLVRQRRLGAVAPVPAVAVVDGCDRMVAPADLGWVTDQVYEVRFLITSSQPLGLRDEHVVWLGPLPTGSDPRSAGSAGELLLMLAEQGDARFDPSGVAEEHLHALCELVEGYPLGLGVLASRLTCHHPQTLSARVAHGAGERLVPAHWPDQLEALLSVVEQDVPPAAAVLLRHLSIWEGPIPLDLMVESDSTPHLSSAELPDIVDQLAGAHCLEVVRRGGIPAYRMPRAVRDHLLRRVERLEEVSIAQGRRAQAISQFVRARAQLLLCFDPVAHGEVDLIHADLAGALAHLTARDTVAAGLQLAVDLGPLIIRRGYDGLVGHHLELLLQLAEPETVGDDLRALATALLAQVRLVYEPSVKPRREARALREAVELSRGSADPEVSLRCLVALLQCRPFTLDDGAALAAAEVTVASAQTMSPRWQGLALGWSGLALAQIEQLDAAVDHYHRLVDHLARHDEPEGRFVCVLLKSLLAADADEPAPRLAEVLAESRERGDVHHELILLKVGAAQALQAGDAELAARRCVESLLLHRGDFWRSELYTVTHMVTIALSRHDLPEGAMFHGMVQRHLNSTRQSLPATLAEPYGRAVGRIRQELGDPAFARACDRGRWMDDHGAMAMLVRYARLAAGEPLAVPPPLSSRVEAAPLTPREQQVLDALATGATNKEIAQRLGLTAKTVMHHATAIYHKLGVRSRAEAVAWATRRRRD